MAFNLFGPPTKDDIRVGYIDPKLGYVSGVNIRKANQYAIKNPGTTFIFRDGNNVVRYLNINEVNQLDPNLLKSTEECGGDGVPVPPEPGPGGTGPGGTDPFPGTGPGGTSGGINRKTECGPPKIQLFAGGGIGASANPVIGRDGALLAVDVVRGGNGYQYPPLASAKDNCNYGSGAKLTAILGSVAETIETFENEADFEDPIIDEDDVEYGRRYGRDGEDLGPWDPLLYADPGEDPIRKQIQEFERSVREECWTTRTERPTKITCSDSKIIPSKYDVTFPAWNEFMNSYAISPVSPSNVRGSDFAGKIFTFEWVRDFSVDCEYIFRGLSDNIAQLYIDDVKIADLDGFNSPVIPIKKKVKKGLHTIRIDLQNTSPSLCRERYYDYRYGGAGEVCPGSASRRGQWFEANDGNWYPVVPRMQSNMRDVQNIFVNTLNRPGHIFEIENAFNIHQNESPEALKNFLLRTQSRRSVAPRTRCGFNYFGTNLPDVITYCSSTNPFTRLGSVTGEVRPLGVDESLVNSSGVVGGTSKDGVIYEGPPLFHYRDNRWGQFMNTDSVSPFLPPIDVENPDIIGTKTYTWKGVKFPESGQYDISFQADNAAKLFLDGIEALSAQNFNESIRIFKVNVTQGTYNLAVECVNFPGITSLFTLNPTGFALDIRKNVSVRSSIGKSWDENPIGIGAILIPPPCPRKIFGRGVVTDVIVNDPGNGYLRPIPQDEGYPVALRLKEVIVEDPGINYDCVEDELRITPSNGAELDYICDPFGKIREVKVLNPGLGFTEYPEIRIISETGVNASFRPVFEVVRDPIVVDPERLIQVTDLVGLKQTGYVNGRPYYGSVYYDQGVRYAGFYETIGEPVQVYDTLQESITAQITTPPSAIQRSGTDIRSNNPRLNIPGTPENLI